MTGLTNPPFVIKEIVASDLASLHREFSRPPWYPSADRWDKLLAAHDEGTRKAVIALVAGAAVGYCSLVYRSEYPPFNEAGIPEIHNLAVAESAQRKVLGRGLVTYLENVARKSNRLHVGVGVGLSQKFGPAQRLYAKLGYLPNGRGATSADCEKPSWGFPILWLTKALQN